MEFALSRFSRSCLKPYQPVSSFYESPTQNGFCLISVTDIKKCFFLPSLKAHLHTQLTDCML